MVLDAFPTDASETTDTDSDGIGDNSDAFPTDPSETLDTDGDGVGNNADTDDDGDGVSDDLDNCPLIRNSDQANNDGDSQGDACDTDDDNDGVADDGDAFPFDPTESVDSDGDGVGNNEDADDDGDGTPDAGDAFPLDPNEDTDTDGDGIGNNADTDDDNDGIPDSEDACPQFANPDQSPCDSDNDGISDSRDAFRFIPIAEYPDANGNGAPDTCNANCLSTGMFADQIPKAMDVYASTLKSSESQQRSTTVILTGVDAEFDDLTYTLMSQPSHGVLTDPASESEASIGLLVSQRLSYSPNADYSGEDTFTYRVNDGVNDSEIRTATITVFDAYRSSAKSIGGNISYVGDNRKTAAMSMTGQEVVRYSNNIKIFDESAGSWQSNETAVFGAGGSPLFISFDDGETVVFASNSETRVYRREGTSLSKLGGDLSAGMRQNFVNISRDTSGEVLALSDGSTTRIFHWYANVWTQRGRDFDGRRPALADDGRTLAVALGKSSKIYRSVEGVWSEVGSIIFEGPDTACGRGVDSISLSSDGLTAAFAFEGCDGHRVAIYEWRDGDWSQKGDDIGISGDWLDRAPNAVNISANGQIVAVTRATAHYGGDHLVVETYRWDGSNWLEQPTDQLRTGSPISLSGDARRLALVNTSGFFKVFSLTNFVPEIRESPALFVEAGSSYSSSISADDRDVTDVEFTYSITNKPPWLSLDTLTGELSGSPSEADIGVFDDIYVAASDGELTDVFGPFSIEVLDGSLVDTDNDGVPDVSDNCPLTSNSDQANNDDDSEGDACDDDDDNDGVNDSEDDFPLDDSETTDTDGDGVGNNADADDDNDGYSDEEELRAGSDPLDSSSTPDETAAEPLPAWLIYVASLPSVVSVEISASGDDGFQLYLDGELIMEDSNWKVATRETVSLRRGPHVIAVKGTNAAGGSDAGAVIVDLLGPDFRIASSSDWEVSLDAGNTWNQLDGALVLPESAVEYGAVDSRRWWNRGGTDSTGASLEGANFPLDSPAKWIWSSGFKTDAVVYFRKEFVVE